MSKMLQKIHLGKNLLSGRKISLPFEELKNHMHILGRTRQGKSKLLESIARDIIKSGYGLLLMDGKGDLYDDLVKFCVLLRQEKKTLFVDPNDTKYSPGINYLELFDEGEAPGTHAKIVMEGMKKIFGQQDEYKAWLEEWGQASLVPLIREKQTLLELYHFMSVVNSEFRESLIQKTGDGFLKVKWEDFARMPNKDQIQMTNVLRTRASEFWYTPAIKYMLGQKKTTINWRKVMDTGGVVLCNLGISKMAPAGLSNFLGTILLHQIIYNAYERPKGKRRPFFIIVDEFNRFACDDFCEALDRLAGYEVYLILANQYNEQIKEMNPQLFRSVMANCLNKVSFSISREDAETMALELFTGYIRGDIIKDEIRQTKFRPVETTREINAHADGVALGDVQGRVDSTGYVFYPDSTGIGSSQTGQATTHSSSGGSTSSNSKSVVPWYEYKEFEEVSGRSFFGLDEILEKFISQIVTQTPRHAQLKIGQRKPIPIETAFVKEVTVREKDVGALKEKIYNKVIDDQGTPYGRLTTELEKEIEGRIEKFLKISRAKDVDYVKPPPRSKKMSPKKGGQMTKQLHTYDLTKKSKNLMRVEPRTLQRT